MEPLTIHATARRYPALPYKSIQKAVLGPKYHVSLTFLGASRARALNMRTRRKSYVPNVLAFPLTKNAGEIYITPIQARKEAAAFKLTERGYIGYLFIHGLLHLKGHDHGARMEKLERKFLTAFKLK